MLRYLSHYQKGLKSAWNAPQTMYCTTTAVKITSICARDIHSSHTHTAPSPYRLLGQLNHSLTQKAPWASLRILNVHQKTPLIPITCQIVLPCLIIMQQHHPARWSRCLRTVRLSVKRARKTRLRVHRASGVVEAVVAFAVERVQLEGCASISLFELLEGG